MQHNLYRKQQKETGAQDSCHTRRITTSAKKNVVCYFLELFGFSQLLGSGFF
jgi:hypothetical protein